MPVQSPVPLVVTVVAVKIASVASGVVFVAEQFPEPLERGAGQYSAEDTDQQPERLLQQFDHDLAARRR